jgi:hypothetical protein
VDKVVPYRVVVVAALAVRERMVLQKMLAMVEQERRAV